MSENIKFQELQNFLNQNEIPKIKGKPKTFLGIAKQPHYENVISNIYAFFFNVNEEHHFKDLFIKSLLELLKTSRLGKEKSTLINTFFNFEITTEYTTNKGGRIDLLLSSPENSIIIENKVYHHLNNNLDDYWESVSSTNKIGVILSLQHISRSNYSAFEYASNFICITHKKLMQQIQKNMGLYLLDANEKYTIFLKDFIQNITNLSTKMMNKKEIDFYFKNQQKIRDTKAFLESVEHHVKTEIEKAGNVLNGVNLNTPRANSNSSNVLRYFISDKNKNLMFTILFDKLTNGENKLVIIIELQHKALKDKRKYHKIDLSEEELKICFTDNFLNTNNFWAHFALKEYILEAEDIHNLSSFIIDKLEKDNFISIFRKLESFLEN
ncbi:hypothetical protein DUT90_01950 [Polaribacter sp. WD7]|uniref:PD-(D/E)XK nuclease family protein n=1 Tax=Polaribacter sp. WD7 TaxID=2269061 RepID=UPI000DF3A672|nr:PD-(D/E)XK nuclease family protein [Polaribacter sp. WD7]RCS28094.1 hypothetical protein DUT90_01950 [Polaribacter sp. WD7]